MAKGQTQRSCQPCTACCDGGLQIRVNGVAVHPGRACPHSTGSGCDDYQHRPVDPCVHFVCGWRSAQVVENGAFTNRQAFSAFGPPEFQREMAQKAAAGERPW